MKIFALLPLFILLATGCAVAHPANGLALGRPAPKVVVLAPGQTLHQHGNDRVTILRDAPIHQMKHHKKIVRHEHRAPATIIVIND